MQEARTVLALNIIVRAPGPAQPRKVTHVNMDCAVRGAEARALTRLSSEPLRLSLWPSVLGHSAAARAVRFGA